MCENRHQEESDLEYRQLVSESLRSLAWMGFLMLVACAVGYLAYKGVGMPPAHMLEDRDITHWFARSGAVITVLGLLVHMRLSDLNEKLQPPGMTTQARAEVWKVFGKWIKLLNGVHYALIFFGTLIWGYGDVVIAIVKELAARFL